MYRIRFHGRGGQGMKTASRILGTALFHEGFEVQDAPRYGAERRGAPVFAFVRADRAPIYERGILRRADLVVVADDTLVPVPAAGVLAGCDAHNLLLIHSHTEPETWRHRLNLAGSVVVLPPVEEEADRAALPTLGATCAGAAARLLGVVSSDALAAAIDQELTHLGEAVVQDNRRRALGAYRHMAAHQGRVQESPLESPQRWPAPAWIDLPAESVDLAAPAIHAGGTSEQVPTGLWRTLRPVIDYALCNRCWWVCSTFCPDGAIALDAERYPRIDYQHCKGCLICLAQCPPHAIAAVPEHLIQAQEVTR
jgi:pyruvate ferredoxin oxidoreductase gamma subunit